jgi:hypothetical protein
MMKKNEINLGNGVIYKGGAFIDRLDNRDFQFADFGQAGVPFNWAQGVSIEARLKEKLGSSFTIPVKNQGTSSSCGGQLGSYYAAVAEALNTGVYQEKSARFLYAQNYLPDGGMYMRDIFDTLVNKGDPDAVMLPDAQTEEMMRKSLDISDDIRTAAKFCKAKAYASVPVSVDTVAQAIDAGNGAGLLIQGSNNGSWRSAYPVFPKSGEDVWGHFVYAVGAQLILGKKFIKIINSWGQEIGQEGYQYISEDYVKSGYVAACRTMMEISNIIGWAAIKYITVSGGIAKTTANLNLRDNAGLQANRILTIPTRTIVDVLGDYKTVDGLMWGRVKVI